MAFFKYVGPGQVTYPTYKITVSPNDVIDFGAGPPPNDGQWQASAGPANNPAVPVTAAGLPVVRFQDGDVGVWSAAAGAFLPSGLVVGAQKKARSARNLPNPSLPYEPFPAGSFSPPGISGSNSDPGGLAHPTVRAIPVAPSTTVAGPLTADPCLIHGSVAYAVDASGGVTTAQPHGVTAPDMQSEWVTDSPLFAVRVTNFNTTGFYIFVGNELIASYDGAPGFGTSRLVFDWSGHTFPRKPRHYRIVSGTGFAVSGFVGDATDTFRAPKITRRIKAGWMGDSYSQAFLGIQYQVSRLLGWDIVLATNDGGTGYAASGAGTQPFSARVPDLVAAGPDVVLIPGGLNDAVTGLQAAATSVFQSIRAGLPDALIFAIGPAVPPATTLAAQAPKLAALQAAAAAVSNTYVIDVTDVFTGTGNTTNPTGDGNADVYFASTDTTHPIALGRALLSQTIADRVTALLPY